MIVVDRWWKRLCSGRRAPVSRKRFGSFQKQLLIFVSQESWIFFLSSVIQCQCSFMFSTHSDAFFRHVFCRLHMRHARMIDHCGVPSPSGGTWFGPGSDLVWTWFGPPGAISSVFSGVCRGLFGSLWQYGPATLIELLCENVWKYLQQSYLYTTLCSFEDSESLIHFDPLCS